MIVETICDHCGMEYDWAGVTLGDRVYWCLACSRGEPCTCLQHAHGDVSVASGDTVIVE